MNVLEDDNSSTTNYGTELKYFNDLIPLLRNLSNGTLKYSKLLNTTSISLYNLLNGIIDSRLIYNNDDNDEYIIYMEKWNNVVNLLNSMSIGLEDFSNKLLDKLLSELELYNKNINKFMGTNNNTDDFINILNNLSANNTKNTLNDIRLRRNIIYSYSEHNTSKKFVRELQHIHADERITNILKKSLNRVYTTKKLLNNAIDELIKYDPTYNNYFKNYIYALNDVVDLESCKNNNSLDENTINININHEKFKHCTFIIENLYNELNNTIHNIVDDNITIQ